MVCKIQSMRSVAGAGSLDESVVRCGTAQDGEVERDGIGTSPAVKCDRVLYCLRALGGRVHHRDDELVAEVSKPVLRPGPEVDDVT